MAVPLLHLIGLMSHPTVDNPLVDATGGAVAGKGMPKRVPTTQDLPLAVLDGAPEVVIGFIARNQAVRRLLCFAATYVKCLAKCFGATGMVGKPSLQDFDKKWREGHPTMGSLSSPSLFLVNDDGRTGEVNVVQSGANDLTSSGSSVGSKA